MMLLIIEECYYHWRMLLSLKNIIINGNVIIIDEWCYLLLSLTNGVIMNRCNELRLKFRYEYNKFLLHRWYYVLQWNTLIHSGHDYRYHYINMKSNSLIFVRELLILLTSHICWIEYQSLVIILVTIYNNNIVILKHYIGNTTMN